MRDLRLSKASNPWISNVPKAESFAATTLAFQPMRCAATGIVIPEKTIGWKSRVPMEANTTPAKLNKYFQNFTRHKLFPSAPAPATTEEISFPPGQGPKKES